MSKLEDLQISLCNNVLDREIDKLFATIEDLNTAYDSVSLRAYELEKVIDEIWSVICDLTTPISPRAKRIIERLINRSKSHE